MQKETKDADFTEYNTHIAELIDHGEGSVAIAKAVVLADQNGMAVPTSPLCQADRFRIIQASVPENQRALMTKALDEREFNWFSLDNVASSIRHLLKDQNYGLGEDEVNAWLDENGTPSLTRQIKAMFGNRSKAQNLRDLGLLGENWQWSEVGFQRHRVILEEAIESGCEPNFEWLRWETHQRHNSDQPFPFKWALMNESLPQAVLHRARRLASIALSGGMVGDSVKVGQLITPEQYKVLRKIGAWISDPLIYDQQDNLLWLGVLAKQPGVNWQNWEQVCSFVSDKLDQVPDRELLRAWQEGTVTFEGTGRYRQNPVTPFVGVKVGRNDQCPCGSNKKFKKCCGM